MRTLCHAAASPRGDGPGTLGGFPSPVSYPCDGEHVNHCVIVS
jgi:hypothetical protein